MTVGERIKHYRKKLSITQEYLAKELNISPQNIYKYENGIITNIPLSVIEGLAACFGITPSELAGWTELKVNTIPSENNSMELSDFERSIIERFRNDPSFLKRVSRAFDIDDITIDPSLADFHADYKPISPEFFDDPSSHARAARPQLRDLEDFRGLDDLQEAEDLRDLQNLSDMIPDVIDVDALTHSADSASFGDATHIPEQASHRAPNHIPDFETSLDDDDDDF